LGITESPEERAARLQAQFQQEKQQQPGILGQPSTPKYDADLIPDIEPRKISDEDTRLNTFMDNFDILEGYRRFIGKMEPKESGRRTEGIMVSCPLPQHPDLHPSAWCNTEKNLWHCGSCHIGGDIYDLGAIHFGYDLNSYKRNGTFPKLKRQMAERLGFIVVEGMGGTAYVVSQEPELEPEAKEQPPASVPAPPVSNVVELHVVDPEVEEANADPLDNEDVRIDWEKIAPENTYLHTFMRAVSIDDLPHEYYFWEALQALGFACGNDVWLADFKPVRSNIFVCTYGPTGSGKSRAMSPYIQVLQEAMPFDGKDQLTPPTGVMMCTTPGSAEGLIDTFKWEILDPSTMKPTDLAPITGLVRIEEFSSFIARASRLGSAMKETLIELYDTYSGEVTLRSRGAGITRAKAPFMQLLTTTQPKAIHSFLRRSDVETGLLNRMIVAAGKPRRAPISYGGVQIDVGPSAKLLRNVRTWASMGHRLELVGDALDAWDYFFHSQLAKFKSGEVETESMLSRIDLTLKKVIIHLTANQMLAVPTGEIVEQAVSLYPYLGITYTAFGSDIVFNDTTECQNRLIQAIGGYIDRHTELPTARNITQIMGKRFDSELVIRSLKNLMTLDVVYEEAPKSSGRGRPTKRYGLSSYGKVK
jgi:hypothetical protein